MVDCNGTLHPRRFGAACHLGVKLGEPTFGVAKNLPILDNAANGFPLDSNGPQQKKLVLERVSLLRKGQKLDLYGPEGTVDGVALVNSNSKNPVFVSPGHLVTLETATEITLRCSIHRIPEPTRQADVKSNADARNHLDST
nr:endonuclease v [Hymenolepis microstoma]